MKELSSQLQGSNFRGVQLKETQPTRTLPLPDATTESAVRSRVVTNLISFIEKRFETLQESPVLSTAAVFHPSNWPENRQELSVYGNHAISTLLGHYRHLLQSQVKGFDEEACKREWQELKVCIRNHYNGLKYLPLWEKIFKFHYSRYQYILKLVEIVLLLPMSTACCERGFSAVKRIKSDWRASLHTATLNNLLFVSQNIPDEDQYDPLPAVLHWWNDSERPRRH